MYNYLDIKSLVWYIIFVKIWTISLIQRKTYMADMNQVSNEPLYNIGVVSRMTGISMATLRAWERRYDFPDSHRTAGGHRLYSERDILRLRWVRQRVDEGMQTSQSIQALRHQETTGHAVLVDLMPGQANGMQATPLISTEKREEHHSYLGVIRERVLDALVHRNTRAVDEVLSEAMALTSPEEIILGVIGPVLATIGDLWENGKVSVATEHLATNYLRQRLLMWMVSGPPSRSVAPIVLACAPQEWHEGSLLVMGALLRRRRWPVAYLGQALPLDELAKFVRDIKPAMVILVGMVEDTASSLADWPQHMPDIFKTGRPIIGYSGRAFVKKPELRLKVPGIFLGSTFEEGIETIEKLLETQ